MININKALDKEARSNVMDEKDTVYPILEQTIRDVSFKRQNTDILGSYRLRSQLYTSDVDLYEVVIGKTSSVKTRFQRKMRKLLNNDTIYIGDIKCGLYEPFRIIDETSYIHQGKVYRYDQKKALVRLDKLKDDFKFIWRKGIPEGKIEWLFDQNEQNAMKIHEFLKGVADKHLGKTYLVKIINTDKNI